MMVQQERLMAALFDRPGKEHIDVKFLLSLSPFPEADAERIYSDAADFIDAMHDGPGDETFAEDFSDRQVSVFLS